MGSQQQFSLRWNNYLQHITSAFDSLRDEDDFVDVTLSCDGKKIRAHKMLLSACSSYFRDLFKENPCPHPIIILKGVKFSDLEALVDFMYNGEVNVDQENLGSFLHTAELLQIRGLTDGSDKAAAAGCLPEMQPSEATVKAVDPLAPTAAAAAAAATHPPPQATSSSSSSPFHRQKEDGGPTPAKRKRPLEQPAVSQQQQQQQQQQRPVASPMSSSSSNAAAPSPTPSTSQHGLAAQLPPQVVEIPDADEVSVKCEEVELDDDDDIHDGKGELDDDGGDDSGMAYEAMDSGTSGGGGGGVMGGKVDDSGHHHEDLEVLPSGSRGIGVASTSGGAGVMVGDIAIPSELSIEPAGGGGMGSGMPRPGSSSGGEGSSQDNVHDDSQGQYFAMPGAPNEADWSPSESAYPCPICGKRYRSHNALRHHLALHKGRTVCPVCQGTYSNVSNLHRHMAKRH